MAWRFYRIIVLLVITWNAMGQCPVAEFTVPSANCVNEVLELENTSQDATSFAWDFCAGSIANTPTTLDSRDISGGQNFFDIEITAELNEKIVFIVSNGNGKLIRLSYGDSFSQVPVPADLGNLGVLTNPQGISLWTEGTEKYALITNAGAIYRLDFGNSYMNTPSAAILPGAAGLGDLRHLKAFRHNGDVYVVAAAGSSNRIAVLSFGLSIANSPSINTIDVPSASYLTGLEVVTECDDIVVLASGYFSGLHMIDFGTSLSNTPSFRVLTDVGAPLGLFVEKSLGSYHAFVNSGNDGLNRLDFGASLDNTPTKTVLGTFGVQNFSIGFTIYKAAAHYYGFSINYNDAKLLILDFPKACSNDNSFADVSLPQTSYSAPGTFWVEMTASNASGIHSKDYHQITVNDLPDIDFGAINACEEGTTEFEAINTSGNIEDYAWNFGDANTSLEADPSNVYTTFGEYEVKLDVTDNNGCTNSAEKIVVVKKAEADFDLPTVPSLCTNQVYDFNSTIASYPANTAIWEWQLDGETISASESVQQSFDAIDDYILRLTVTNGECSSFMEKIVSMDGSGPSVDFEVQGQCEEETIGFKNLTTGDVSSYLWSFGPGDTSTGNDAEFVFSSYGQYEITLTAFGSTGCDNSISKEVAIGAKPLISFSTSPPVLCSSKAFQFVNNSTIPAGFTIDEWQWHLGDGSESDYETPENTYNQAGDISIKLIATSNLGCMDSLESVITINPTPIASFNPSVFSGTVPLIVSFSNSSVDAENSSWDFGSEGASTEPSPSFEFLSEGEYEVELLVKSSVGCEDSVVRNIKIGSPDSPVAFFDVSEEVCISQNLMPTNHSVAAEKYKWDFCAGSLLNAPLHLNTLNVTAGQNFYDFDNVEEAGSVFGFAVSWGNNKLFRFDFGNSLSETPTANDLGNLGVLSTPQGIALWSENANKYALITSSTGVVYLLNFGSSYSNTPIVNAIPGLTGLSDLRHLKVFRYNSNVYAAIAAGGMNQIIILSFGTSILNEPVQVNIDVPASSFLTGLDVVVQSEKILVITSGFASGLHVVDFDNSLSNTPSFRLFTEVADPLGVFVEKTLGNYHVFVSSNASGLNRLDFEDSFTTPPSRTVLGGFSVQNLAIAFSIYRSGSHYYGISINYNDTNLLVLDFPKDCPFDDDYADQNEPQVLYSVAGTYYIELETENSFSGDSHFAEVVVSALQAPTIDFTTVNACEGEPTNFNLANTLGNIEEYDWDFGDGNTSEASEPTNVYASQGTYAVKLTVEADNACENFAKESVTVRLARADFDLPTDIVLCTNQQYALASKITSYPTGSATWEWLINGVAVSDQEATHQSFGVVNDYVVRLTVSNGECSHFTEKTISIVSAGPSVNFETVGQCEGESIFFQNQTIGEVATYNWSFGQGDVSEDTNPEFVYTTFGSYVISLTAANNVGCENSAEQTIIIYSKPQPDFNTDLPPFSCSGTSTQFNDLTPVLTDSNLDEWSWEFDDNGATADAPSPQHTYALSGTYDVTLTVVSDKGCTNATTKEINIAQSPSPVISTSPLCVNVGVELSEASGAAGSGWQWQVGNSFYSSEIPSHVFSESGNHTISLVFTADNGCISTTSKSVFVPQPLLPDFSGIKKCVDEQAVLTATSTGPESVDVFKWNIGTNELFGQSINYPFEETGLTDVLLTVTSASGCNYTITKALNIVPAPQANFSSSTEFGPPPLAVQFTNQSTDASQYLWHFNDAANTTTEAFSPAFAYTEIGNYVVDLTAINGEGCENTISKLIQVAFPVISVDLTNFEVIENANGTRSLLITLQNNGNLMLNNAVVQLRLGEAVIFDETVAASLAVGQSSVYQLSTTLSSLTDAQWICVVLKVDQNTEEQIPLCSLLKEETTIVAPGPNPASDMITVQWISKTEGVTHIEMVSSTGTQVTDIEVPSTEGFNSYPLGVSDLLPGLYFLRISSGNTVLTFRTIIAR